MNAITTSLRLLVITLMLLLAACAVAPVQEMSNARQAIEAARQAGAATHAPLELAAAERSLQQAEAALKTGDYRNARQHADAARTQAVAAQKKALNR